jgi:hypothetical protein
MRSLCEAHGGAALPREKRFAAKFFTGAGIKHTVITALLYHILVAHLAPTIQD